ncbi:MAG: hypothetical protein CMO55_02865 [Verrucomicrobiales bacterium]|nr:hypothetical protein [Verrucomicrobiales bacterium]
MGGMKRGGYTPWYSPITIMIWKTNEERVPRQVSPTNAPPTRPKADIGSTDLGILKNQIERLSLSCQAMWELLRDHSDLTEEHLEQKIVEIDARDGTVDGRMTIRQVTCPQCGNMTHSKRTSCVICGEPLHRDQKFEV